MHIACAINNTCVRTIINIDDVVSIDEVAYSFDGRVFIWFTVDDVRLYVIWIYGCDNERSDS